MTWKFGPVTNLTLSSNNLSNATYWGTTVNGVASAAQGATDPVGGATATTITETTGNTGHFLVGIGTNQISYVSGTTYVKSLYAKAGTATVAQLTLPSGNFSGLGYANFNLSTCAVSASGGTLVSSGASVDGSGFCRAWITATATASGAASTSDAVFVNNNLTATRIPTYTGTGATMIAYCDQTETISYVTQTTPGPCVLTSTATATSTAQLRIGTGTGLLVEESRQNIVFPSQADDDATWTKTQVSCVANTTAAPDGTTTADTCTGSGAASVQYILASPVLSFTSGSVYTFSRYFHKSSTQPWVQMTLGAVAFGGAGYQNFNVQTCTTGTPGGTLVSSGAYWAGNYCRVWVTATATATTTGSALVYFTSSGADARAPGTVTSTGTMIGWCNQVEQVPAGTTTAPTSCVPTTTAGVSRSGDVITGTVAQLLGASPNVATIVVNAGNPVTANSQAFEGVGITGVSMGANATGNSPRVLWRHGSVSRTDLGNVTVNGTLGTPLIFAVSSDSAVTAVGAANGMALTTSAAPAQNNWSTSVSIGSRNSAGNSLFWNQPIQRIRIWWQPLTQALINTITNPPPVLFNDFANDVHTYNGYNVGTAGLSSLYSVANSGGYCTNGSGALVGPFSANTARICPGTGLLPEDTRTNSIRNSTATGAVPGSPGTFPTNWFSRNNGDGLTAAIAGTGTSNGIPYVDVQVSGTTTSAAGFDVVLDAITAIAATNSQTWSVSSYLALVGGSFTNISNAAIDADNYTAGSVAIGHVATANIIGMGANLSRFSGSGTTADATTAFMSPYLRFNVAGSGVAINFTVRVGLPQLEVGAFPTSPIATTTVAGTRNFDNIQALGPVLNLLGTQGANAMSAAWTQSQYYSSAGAANRTFVALYNVDGGNSRWSFPGAEAVAGDPRLIIGDGVSTASVPSSQPTYPVSTAMKFAARWSNSAADAAASTNSGAASAVAKQFAGTISAPFYIGGAGSSGFGLNMPISSLGFYPGGMTDTQLQVAQ